MSAGTPARPGRFREVDARFELPLRTGIGVVVPFDFRLDNELWYWASDDVIVHVARTSYIDKPITVDFAEELARPETVIDSYLSLAVAQPVVTAYLCNSASFVGGLAGEGRLRAAMEEAGAPVALTASGALLHALDVLGARRLAIATPYDRELAGRLDDFVTEAGYEVTSTAYLGLSGDIWRVNHATAREMVRTAVADDEPDAVFLACTNLPTAGIVVDLEEELGIPVLSANLVTMWAAQRIADVRLPVCHERIFKHAREAPLPVEPPLDGSDRVTAD